MSDIKKQSTIPTIFSVRKRHSEVSAIALRFPDTKLFDVCFFFFKSSSLAFFLSFVYALESKPFLAHQFSNINMLLLLSLVGLFFLSISFLINFSLYVCCLSFVALARALVRYQIQNKYCTRLSPLKCCWFSLMCEQIKENKKKSVQF